MLTNDVWTFNYFCCDKSRHLGPLCQAKQGKPSHKRLLRNTYLSFESSKENKRKQYPTCLKISEVTSILINLYSEISEMNCSQNHNWKTAMIRNLQIHLSFPEKPNWKGLIQSKHKSFTTTVRFLNTNHCSGIDLDQRQNFKYRQPIED